MASNNKQEAKGKVLTLEDALGLVAYQGLRPDMAIRACNNPKITSSILSREISKLVVSVAKNEIARRRLQARAARTEGREEAGRALVARSTSPLSKSSPLVNSTSTFLDLRFGTPYLKNGPSHFQRKVASKIEALARDRPPSPQPVPEKARDDVNCVNDTSSRYDDAIKEATKRFVDIKAGRVADHRSQQEIIDDLNQKYSLNGEGREDSREKHMLSVRTVQRLVQKGEIGSSPVKRGRKPGQPYLKKGPSHSQRKRPSEIEALTRDRPPSPQPAPKKARDDIKYNVDTRVRYDDATKEATVLFADMKAGKVVGRTQQGIIDDLNQKYSLDGEGREDSREKHMLNVRTIQRLVQKGVIGSSPVKKGPKLRINPDQFHIVGLHVSTGQFGGTNNLLRDKAHLAFQTFEEKGSVLAALSTEDLRHLVRYICHVEKKEGDTFFHHSGSKEKMQERLASVEPSWVKYFTSDEEGSKAAACQESDGAADAVAEGVQGVTEVEGGGANDVFRNDALGVRAVER